MHKKCTSVIEFHMIMSYIFVVPTPILIIPRPEIVFSVHCRFGHATSDDHKS